MSPAKTPAKTVKATKSPAQKSKATARSAAPRGTGPSKSLAGISRTSGRAAGSAGASTPRLKTRYREEIQAQLLSELTLGNVMEVPRLDKIVVNMGVGRAVQQPSLIEGAQRDMEVITGQKPVVTRA
ncbi:MAG: 50S ribosomal protein L5, partial [Acidimicrobiales bacterium]